MANITLGSSAASVTFSSISQAYRDLILVYSGTTNTDSYSILSLINSDSGSNYSRVRMTGNGSTTISSATTSSDAPIADESSTARGLTVVNFMDYSATDKHKTMLVRGGTASLSTGAVAVRWANTAAVTSFSISIFSGTWAAGSTFSLFGVAA